MNKAEKYYKEWSSICRIFETKYNPIHHHKTLIDFAEDYHQSRVNAISDDDIMKMADEFNSLLKKAKQPVRDKASELFMFYSGCAQTKNKLLK